LFILSCGDKSVRFRPPLNISRDLIDDGITIISDVLKGE